MHINVLIGGAAGQGMDTIAHLLAKALSRMGYGIHLSKDYMSRVRGGHNFSRIRIQLGEAPASAIRPVDLLVCLNEDTLTRHQKDVVAEGTILWDEDSIKATEGEGRSISVPLIKLGEQAGHKIMSNTVALGSILRLLDVDTKAAKDLLAETFSDKPDVIEPNLMALQLGYDAVTADSHLSLPTVDASEPRIMLDGNQCLGLAAIASGCRFVSAYPMTPASGIVSYLASKQEEMGLIVEQAEDEIAAINMVLGASFAGARSLTATSGGGFALMNEGVSLAGMTETPAVIIIGMRPGPATGLPTRTEQGDLQYAIHAGHGTFPRAVLAATCLEDTFYRLHRAFELADQFQVPVIFLSDQSFADTARNVKPFALEDLTNHAFILEEWPEDKVYRRYESTDSGVSPRAIPGQFPGQVVLADSDEHDVSGYIIEDADLRRTMMEKRMRKMQGLADAMEEPIVFGPDNATHYLVGWGSTYGALKEATETLQQEGFDVGQVHFSDLWPLPTREIQRLADSDAHLITVETNFSGQLADLISMVTGIRSHRRILSFDGRPMMAQQIVDEVKSYVQA